MIISAEELEALEAEESRKISEVMQAQMGNVISQFREAIIESVALMVAAEAEPINRNDLVCKIRSLKVSE